MQPLISPVDHESRHNSYRGEDVPRPSEQTPLLHRFPPSQARDSGNTHATIVITLLLVILISGVIIGIYLLIVQNNSENILPPEDIALQMVSLSQWSPNNSRVTAPAFRARQVVVVQTDSRECNTVLDCKQLLTDMQRSDPDGLPYNFLLSSNGQTFEALGWRRSSPIFSKLPTALVLAFIGNFTEAPPTKAQLAEARNFFAVSVSLQRLDPSYSIVGKSTKYTPKYLFKTLSKLPQWNKELSDKYR